MDAVQMAARAQERTSTQGESTPDRDPLAAYTLTSDEADAGHGGTVRFGDRTSTGVPCLVYLPRSRKRAQGVPVSAILAAGFHALTQEECDLVSAFRAEAQEKAQKTAPKSRKK